MRSIEHNGARAESSLGPLCRSQGRVANTCRKFSGIVTCLGGIVIGIAAISSAVQIVGSAQAEPRIPGAYTDQSGLQTNRFTWQPTLQERGSVVLVCVRPAQMLHVYRNGIQIGMVRGAAVTRQVTPSNLLAFDAALSSAGSEFVGRPLWNPSPANAAAVARSPSRFAPCLRLPSSFQSYLRQVAPQGAMVITADDLMTPRITATDWPRIGKSRLVAVNEAAQKATDVLGLSHGAPFSSAPRLVISGADKTASLWIDAKRRWRTRVDIQWPERAIGTHVLSRLISPSPLALAGRQWLAVSARSRDRITRQGAASSDIAVAVLERIKISDRGHAKEADLALATPGATIIVTDHSADVPPGLAMKPQQLLISGQPVARARPPGLQALGAPRARPVSRPPSPPKVIPRKPRRSFGPQDLPGME